MRARRTPPAAREDYDSFDPAPPESYDPTPEAPVDEAPPDAPAANDTAVALTAPARVCLACGDDPSFPGGCPHDEVATFTELDAPARQLLGELRAAHEGLRALLRSLRRSSSEAVARERATVFVREPPVVAPRVVLVPPPSTPRRPRRVAGDGAQGRFGFLDPAPDADESGNR